MAVSLATFLCCATGAVFALANVRGVAIPFVLLTGAVLGCGWAATGWMDARDAAYAASLAIAAGIALLILVSIVSLEAAWWHPAVTVGVMLALAAVGNAAIACRDARRWLRS